VSDQEASPVVLHELFFERGGGACCGGGLCEPRAAPPAWRSWAINASDGEAVAMAALFSPR
jgi:hypothetical protein